mgnify:CR=1 FL=1
MYIFKRNVNNWSSSSTFDNLIPVSGLGSYPGVVYWKYDSSQSDTNNLQFELWRVDTGALNTVNNGIRFSKQSDGSTLLQVNVGDDTGTPSRISSTNSLPDTSSVTLTVTTGSEVYLWSSNLKAKLIIPDYCVHPFDTETWSQQAKIQASDIQADDRFGSSVDIDGDYAIVGANGEDTGASNVGAAYIFKRTGTAWAQQAKIQASDKEQDDKFGASDWGPTVSISGNIAVVGAHQEDTGGANSGAAYIFERSGTSWTEVKKITASDAQAADEFGTSVGIDGNNVIVGAYLEDTKGSNAGAAYIFSKAAKAVPTLNFDGYNKLTIDNVLSSSSYPDNLYHSVGYWAGTSPVHYHKLDTSQSNETSKLYELWQTSLIGGQYGIGFYKDGNTTVLKVNEGDNSAAPTYFKINGSGSHASHVIELGNTIELWGSNHEGGFTVTENLLF